MPHEPDDGDEPDDRDGSDERTPRDEHDQRDEHSPRDERDGTDESDGEAEPNASDRDASGPDRTEPTFGLLSGLDAFADLLRSLEEADDRRGSGRVERDGTTIDYDVAVGLGPGPSAHHGGSGRGFGSRRRGERRNRDRTDREPSRDYHVTTREIDDAVVVVADLPGVDADDLTVGVESDRETLVIGVDDAVVERVSLPWPARTTEHAFQNGVLEVRLREDR